MSVGFFLSLVDVVVAAADAAAVAVAAATIAIDLHNSLRQVEQGPRRQKQHCSCWIVLKLAAAAATNRIVWLLQNACLGWGFLQLVCRLVTPT